MFHLVSGPMFSGKTTKLVGLVRKAHHGKKKVTVVKFSGDTRYSETSISSHDGDICDSISCTNLADLENLHLLGEEDILFIDELQFYKDAVQIIPALLEKGVEIVATCLNGDFTQKPFPVVSQLLPYVTRYTLKTAICKHCKSEDAVFSCLKASKPADYKDGEPLIGGVDKYVPLCIRCYKEEK
jgi:thymidine kinase